jgi:hypothetical protein
VRALLDLHALHLLEGTDSRLHLTSLRGLVAKPLDEALDPRDLRGLLLRRLLERRPARFAGFEVVVVVSRGRGRPRSSSATLVTIRLRK